MTGSLPIVFNKKDNFEKSVFIQFLKNSYKVTCEDKNETTSCKIESIGTTILIHKYRITIQGQLNKETKDLISKMTALNQLTLDPKYIKKYEEIFQPNNGLIICQDCGQPSEVIEGVSDSSENPMFKCSCGHELMTNSPILIARNRILPDLNILISRTLSRLIQIGYFNGFEIIIPEYFDKFIDQCFGRGKRRTSFLSERENLSKLAKQGMIRIQTYPYGGSSIENCNEEGKIEDDKIFDFATKTHSILITADRTLKDKSIEHNLECIYFTSDLNNSAKLQFQLSLK